MFSLLNMEHFLKDVNHTRLLFFFGNVLEEELTKSGMVEVAEGKMDEGGEHSMRVDTQDIFEWMLIKNPKRMNVFEGIETSTNNNTFAGNDKFNFLGIFGKEEVSHYANEDKGNSHQRAIGKKGIGNNKKEEYCNDDNRARIGSHVDMLRSNPREKHSLGWGNMIYIHRVCFFYYTTFEKGGGSERIRTSGTISGTAVFKTAAFNHSATLPCNFFQCALGGDRTPDPLVRSQML